MSAVTGRQRSAFGEFAARKTLEAATAGIERLSTIVDGRRMRGLSIGNAWTRMHYGGDFHLPAEDEGTALSLVFVQSNDGNTGGGDPGVLGGGDTDKHLIYEGLSRVAADAVLAGAGTVYPDAFFSVWHPELVALRHALGLPRHPAQIVISKQGQLDVDALLFNIPDVPVFLIGGDACWKCHRSWLDAHPWVRYVPLVEGDVRQALTRLRGNGIRRISAIGGRFTASRLVDAGLAQDLYLTTTADDGGEAGTPWYSGATPPRIDVVEKKQWIDHGKPITLEHILIS